MRIVKCVLQLRSETVQSTLRNRNPLRLHLVPSHSRVIFITCVIRVVEILYINMQFRKRGLAVNKPRPAPNKALAAAGAYSFERGHFRV